MGERAFLFVIILIGMAAIVAGFVFFQYVFSPSQQELEVSNSEFDFRQSLFESIVENQKKNESILLELENSTYRDIFKGELTP